MCREMAYGVKGLGSRIFVWDLEIGIKLSCARD